MSKQSGWFRFSLAVAAAALVLGSAISAQQSNKDESDRKLKTKVMPVYPDLAHRMNITGKVKIEVVITPDGRVRSTRVVGGHPLLIQACENAVKQWRYYPAPQETTQVTECDFKSND